MTDDTWTKEELEAIGLKYQKEQKQQYAARQAEKYERLAKYSLDEENKRRYLAKEKQWRHVRFRTESEDVEKYLDE